MNRPQHNRAFIVTVAWTLGLLFLGSVVHATESSLACPDWPTCFGTMVPAMEGGVFWEHLHRLVAGGLILMFGLATWFAAREVPADRRWVVKACWAGLALLVVQAVFGGLTVIWRLPDAVSTAHLGLAFLFLALATWLAVATSPARDRRPPLQDDVRRVLMTGGAAVTGLVFVQSVLGGYVRHSDTGMACGLGVLCNGGLLPPAWNHAVGIHFLHRALGVVTGLAVLALTGMLLRRALSSHIRKAVAVASALVLLQIVLGFVSVAQVLAVVPVSLHTLVAAVLLSVTTALTAWGWLEDPRRSPGYGKVEAPELTTTPEP